MVSDNTIITVGDRNFLWGAILLIASLRHHGIMDPVNVITTDLDRRESEMLCQFGGVRVIPWRVRRHYTANLLKPEAILTADTELITWMDADCIVTGDISPYLVSLGESLQVRFRSVRENPLRFRKKYAPDDAPGSIPQAILKTWKHDVGERETSAIATTCSTNCMLIHQSRLGFIKKWRDLLARIIPAYASVSESAYTYRGRISDELVLNALLAFAHDAPPVNLYLLDKDPKAYLVHFVENPKPWIRWQSQYLKHYQRVLALVQWVIDQDFRLPILPPSFNPRYRPLIHTLAHSEAFLRLGYRVLRKQSQIRR